MRHTYHLWRRTADVLPEMQADLQNLQKDEPYLVHCPQVRIPSFPSVEAFEESFRSYKTRLVVTYDPERVLIPSEYHWMWSAIATMRLPGEEEYHQIGSLLLSGLLVASERELKTKEVRLAGYKDRWEMRKELGKNKSERHLVGLEELVCAWRIQNFNPKPAKRAKNDRGA